MNRNIIEERLEIEGIPVLRIYPSKYSEFKAPFASIVYYHGWSSDKNRQKFIGQIFANSGYQVILPDAIHHGERDKFENYNETMSEYCLPTIMQNLKEFPIIQNYLIKNCSADKNRIAVSGHSMGAFSSAGIFAHNPMVKTAVIFNGSCDWKSSFTQMEKDYDGFHIQFDKESEQADPINNIESIANRPIFLLHGMKDSIVSYKAQKQFYDKIFPLYKDKSKIKLMSVDRMNHYISIQMLNEAIEWLNTEL